MNVWRIIFHPSSVYSTVQSMLKESTHSKYSIDSAIFICPVNKLTSLCCLYTLLSIIMTRCVYSVFSCTIQSRWANYHPLPLRMLGSHVVCYLFWNNVLQLEDSGCCHDRICSLSCLHCLLLSLCYQADLDLFCFSGHNTLSCVGRSVHNGIGGVPSCLHQYN